MSFELQSKVVFSFFFFFNRVTGPGRSLILQLSDTGVYEPQIRARLGTTAHFCKVVVLKLRAVPSCADLVHLSIGTALNCESFRLGACADRVTGRHARPFEPQPKVNFQSFPTFGDKWLQERSWDNPRWVFGGAARTGGRQTERESV